jgi:hypothetical protein
MCQRMRVMAGTSSGLGAEWQLGEGCGLSAGVQGRAVTRC